MLTRTSSARPKKAVNKANHKAKLGTGSVLGGDTGLPCSTLYYCGLPVNPCRCGACPTKLCGPTNGCPCADCVELLGYKVNSAGDLCRPGGSIGDGGDTTMTPEHLFYCGKWKMQCRCGTCDGQCGPLSGCPCHSCTELLGFKVNRDGALCRRGSGQGIGIVEPRMKWNELYYCGKRKMECRCGQCGERCGDGSGGLLGGSGCPCQACLELVTMGEKDMPELNKDHFSMMEKVKSTSSSIEAKLIDHPSNINTSPTTITTYPSLLPDFERLHIAKTGGIMLPTIGSTPSAPPHEEELSPSSEDGSFCVICLEQRKQYLLLPCGHYSYCAKCVATLSCCAICRSHIDTKVKVYET